MITNDFIYIYIYIKLDELAHKLPGRTNAENVFQQAHGFFILGQKDLVFLMMGRAIVRGRFFVTTTILS